MRELWEQLCALPHRGSATANEHRAAQIIQEYLQGGTSGKREAQNPAENPLPADDLKITLQPFKAPRSYGPELIFISLLLSLGGWLGWWWLALLGTYGFWAHFSGWWVPWRGLFDRFASHNVLAESGSGPLTLLLMAHYDSAKTFFLYRPGQVQHFRRNFLINAAFATVLPYATFLPWIPQLLGLYFLIQAVFMIHRELTQPYVNGANDNASGVAVAVDLFEELRRRPLPDTRIMLALTGCEEVGAKGAEHLLRSGQVPPGALVLNIDNVGKGELFYATGEGMLGYHAYRGALLQAARKTAGARPLAYKLAFFDTRPFAAGGMAALTLIRLEEGLPPNWHWPSDTPEQVDWQAVEETLSYARGLVRQLAVSDEPRD